MNITFIWKFILAFNDHNDNDTFWIETINLYFSDFNLNSFVFFF